MRISISTKRTREKAKNKQINKQTPLNTQNTQTHMNNKLNNKQITLYITFCTSTSTSSSSSSYDHKVTYENFPQIKFCIYENIYNSIAPATALIRSRKNCRFSQLYATQSYSPPHSFPISPPLIFIYMVKLFDVFWINNLNKNMFYNTKTKKKSMLTVLQSKNIYKIAWNIQKNKSQCYINVIHWIGNK